MNNITYKEIISKCHSNKKNNYKLYYYHRLLSLPVTKLFFLLGVRPDTVSISMIILSFISFLFMINDGYFIFLIGFALSFLAFLLDKVDGDLARLQGVDNAKGAVYDFVYHRISLFLFFLGIGVHFSQGDIVLVALSAIAGFLANYIEEAQLLSFRIYAHKVLYLNEKIKIATYERKTPKYFKYFKILKVFRMQLFLYYYFILAIFFESIFSNSVMLFVVSSVLAMTFYMAFQVYLIHQYSFDNDIRHLTNKIK
jgi:phosphatidylglycerophosphate synthase